MQIQNKKNNYNLISLVVISLLLSLVMAFSTACTNNDNKQSSSSPTSTQDEAKDEQYLANGDFEWYTTDKTSYPYSGSSIKWSKKTDSGIKSAISSSQSSGIIDTSDEAYSRLSNNNKPKDGENYYNPKTPTLTDSEETEVNEKGTKVLMIHNVSSTDKLGTAQSFTSSTTLNLSADKYAILSVWVKTYGLKSLFHEEDNEFGAYIQLNNKVSTSIEPFSIENINTDGKWLNYKIYLEPSDTATTTYTVTLGLGRGSSYNTENYVEGFAYFDNVEYTIYDTAKEVNDLLDAEAIIEHNANLYNGANQNVTLEDVDGAPNPFYNKDEFHYDEANRLGSVAEGSSRVFTLSFAKNLSSMNSMVSIGGGNYNNLVGTAVQHYPAGFTATEITTEKGLVVPANSVYMDFSKQQVGSSYSYTTGNFQVKEDSYYKVTFKAKVKTETGAQKATVEVLDNGKKATGGAFESFNTNGVTANDGFVRYTFYIKNSFPVTAGANDFDVQFRFSFGYSETALTDATSLPIGYAIFNNFEYVELTKDEYEAANANANALKLSVKGEHLSDYVKPADASEDEFASEDYSFNVIKEKYSLLENYAVNSYVANYDKATELPTDTVAGVVNSKYSSNYAITYNAVIGNALDELNNKNKLFTENKYVQPYLIYNENDASYGIRYTSNTTLSANNTYLFSVKVRVTGSAKAYVYLIDKSYVELQQKLSFNPLVLNYGSEKKLAEVKIDNTTPVEADGYVTVSFIVVTGNENKEVCLEMWNGSRDGSEESQGAVFFDSPLVGATSSFASIEDVKKDNNYIGYTFDETKNINAEEKNIYYYYTDGDKDIANNEKVLDDDGNHKFTTLDAKTVYSVSTNGALVYLDYTRTDFEEYKLETKKNEDTTSSDTTSDSSKVDLNDAPVNFGWLQISSVIIALVLIVLLLVICVKKIWEAVAKKKNATKKLYGTYNKENRYIPTAPNKEEKNSDYDYENMENNLEEDTTDSNNEVEE